MIPTRTHQHAINGTFSRFVRRGNQIFAVYYDTRRITTEPDTEPKLLHEWHTATKQELACVFAYSINLSKFSGLVPLARQSFLTKFEIGTHLIDKCTDKKFLSAKSSNSWEALMLSFNASRTPVSFPDVRLLLTRGRPKPYYIETCCLPIKGI